MTASAEYSATIACNCNTNNANFNNNVKWNSYYVRPSLDFVRQKQEVIIRYPCDEYSGYSIGYLKIQSTIPGSIVSPF